MSKRIWCLLVVGALVCGFVAGAGAGEVIQTVQAQRAGDVTFVLGNVPWQPIDNNGLKLVPLMYEGRAYLPIRSLAEAVGFDIFWDESKRQIVITPGEEVSGTDTSEVPYFEQGARELSDEIQAWIEALRRDEGAHVRKDEQYQHVLVAMGQQMTGGYSVDLVNIESGDEGCTVYVQYTAPGPDDMVTQAITYPYLFVTLECTGEVTIVRIEDDEPIELPGYSYDQAQLTQGIEISNPIPYMMVNGEITIEGQTTEESVWVEMEDGHKTIIPRTRLETVAHNGFASFSHTLSYDTPSSPVGTLIIEAGDEVTIIPVRLGDWDYAAK